MALFCVSISLKKEPTSAQTGKSINISNFFISASSISTIIFLAARAKLRWLYAVCPRSSLAPKTRIQSEFCWAKLAPRCPDAPGRPAKSGCSSGRKSIAFHVVKTGTLKASTTSKKSSIALASLTPFPTSITGLSAWLMSWIALYT